MFCENCGRQLSDGAKFCDGCGFSIEPQNRSQAPYGQPQNRPQGPIYPQYNMQPNQGPPKEKSGNILPAIIISATVIIVAIITMILLFVAPGFLRSDYGKNDKKSEREKDDDDKSSKNKSDKDSDKNTNDSDDKASAGNADSKETKSEDEAKDTQSEDTTEAVTEEVTTEDPELVLANFIASMTTDERPDLSDFWWYTESVLYDGVPADAIYFSKHELANGGWKMYMVTDPYVLSDNHSEMWMNANIQTQEDGVTATVTIDWYSMFIGSTGESIDRSGDEDTTFYGSWDNGDLVVEEGAWGKLTFTDFYSIGINQFIIGTFNWVDGSYAQVALIRPGNNIEYTPTDNPYIYATEETETYEPITEAQTQATTHATTEAVVMDPVEPPPPQQSYDIGVILERSAQFTRSQHAEVIEMLQSGELVIHCYDEIVDETGAHIATNDWLTIDPSTMTGMNFMYEYVDLR